MSQPQLIQPQEVEMFYVMPTLRRELAIEMKKLGLKQNKIAELLQIKKSTVSQYINNNRGTKIEFSNEIKQEISKSAPKIKDTLSLIRETQKLIREIRQSCELCKIHKQLADIPEDCEPNTALCFVGEENHV